jgi:hypothetical protein
MKAETIRYFPSVEGLKQQATERSGIELTQQFYNLRQAWELKGGCAWGTFRTLRYYQPKGGHYDGYFGGRGIFFRETIQEWLPLVDGDLPEYHARYLTGAKPKNRIKTIAPLVAHA